MKATANSSTPLSAHTAHNVIASSERKIWPLMGGIHPQENKHQSTGRPVSVPPLPATLVLPLSQHAGSPAEPLVSVGEKVLKGQMIARASGIVSAALHAPTSGMITAIESRPIPHPSGFDDLCIILASDGEERWCELTLTEDYHQIPPATLVDKVRDAGISGLGGAGFPTAIKLAPGNEINTLILNGTECEPYITADDMLMREQAEAVIQGAEILQYILGARECLVGIEDNKPEAIAAMRSAASGKNIEIVVFPTIYPSGGEKQLIRILTGQEVPVGKLPADLGMVVQNVGTAVAVKEAIVDGKPLISRITTLTGDALQAPQNVWALIGTPANDLLQHALLQEAELSMLVFGGPMMGFGVDRLDIPVIKTSNCLIAATREEFPEPPDAQACIRCGHCAEVCPASLLPQQLYWHARAENHEQLLHHNLFDCIECGACSFVCPSAIPLVQYYRASKGAIRTQEAKHTKSERSRQRYESRLARLEQEKAEKEARRKANAERAAQLKAVKATESPEGSLDNPHSKTVEEDPIQAAIARAKARKAAQSSSATAPAGKSGRPEPSAIREPSANKEPSAIREPSAIKALSAQQKELKIQLSMAKAQWKKTERALAAAEASGHGDVGQLKSNLAMLNEQVAKLQQAFDQSTQSTAVVNEPTAVVNEPTEQPVNNQLSVKQAKAPLSDEAKKLKIEAAMANAAVKKLQRTIASASASAGEEEMASLQQQLAQAEQKAAQMKQALENLS